MKTFDLLSNLRQFQPLGNHIFTVTQFQEQPTTEFQGTAHHCSHISQETKKLFSLPGMQEHNYIIVIWENLELVLETSCGLNFFHVWHLGYCACGYKSARLDVLMKCKMSWPDSDFPNSLNLQRNVSFVRIHITKVSCFLKREPSVQQTRKATKGSLLHPGINSLFNFIQCMCR